MASSRKAFVAAAALAGVALTASAGAWQAARSTLADGMRISFSVMPAFAFDPDHQRRGRRSGFDQPHRVAIQLGDAKTGGHISEAEVDLIITSADYASGPLPLRRATGGGRIYFETALPSVPPKALYQVDVRLPGSPRVTSVHFDYRHGE